MALSQEQIAAYRQKYGIGGVKPTEAPATGGAMSDLKAGFSKAQDSFERGMDRTAEASKRDTLFGRISGKLGAGFRFAGDALSNVGEGAVRALPGGDAVLDTINKSVEAVTKPVASLDVTKEAVGGANNLFQKLPKTVRETLGDVGNIAVGGLQIGGAVTLPSVTNSSAKTALKMSDDIFDAAKSRIPKPSIPDATTISKVFDNDTVNKMRAGLSNIDPQVETVLKKSTFDDVNRHFQYARNAVTDVTKPTPLEMVGDKAEEAFDVINAARRKAIEGKKRILLENKDMKLQGNIPGNMIDKLKADAGDRFGVDIGPNGQVLTSKGRVAKLDAPSKKLLTDYITKLRSLGPAPTAQKMDDFIDWAQGALYKQSKELSKLQSADDATVGYLKGLTGEMNGQLKSQIGEGYGQVNDRISMLIDIQDELSRGLGADGRKGGSFVKQLFSPAGNNSRRVFAQIEQLTGIDLAKEATLARYAMETVGDVRQRSLLKSLDVAIKDAAKINLAEPGSWLNFIREKADLDGQKLANEIIRANAPQ